MRKHTLTYLLSASAVLLVAAMVVFPDLSYRSALAGLKLWWDIVFPALLPFFIGGYVLMGLGVVRFLGVLMEPLMRPLFNVPGVGAFVIAMGLNSGYPIGAVLTAELKREGRLTKIEAERLMSFSNTADPLFMGGALAVAMLGQPALAGVIMAAHYLGAISMGLLLRFYRAHDPISPPEPEERGNILWRAITALLRERERDGRPFGQVLGDSVQQSVNTLLMVGALIILFSVIIRVLQQVYIVHYLAVFFALLLGPIGVDQQTAEALVAGFFEITVGSQAAAQAHAPLLDRTMIASAIVAWSGISVMAQVAAVTQGTGVSLWPYVISRIGHASLAAFYTWWLWPADLQPTKLPPVAPALGGLPGSAGNTAGWNMDPWMALSWSAHLFVTVTAVLLAFALAVGLWQGVRWFGFRLR